MSAQELRRLWVDAVRRIGRTDKYFIGRRWDAAFAKAAQWLDDHPSISPAQFVEAQVRWCIGNRVQNALWPNLLLGPGAYERYMNAPREEELIAALQSKYDSQARAFIALSNAVGLQEALCDTMGGWSPLYLCYVRSCSGLPLLEAEREQANKEARAEPLVSRIFPEDFLRSLG